MSLLQEMEKHGLADCEFNRKLLKKTKTFRVIASETHIYSELIEAKDEAQAKSLFMELMQSGLEANDTDGFQIDQIINEGV